MPRKRPGVAHRRRTIAQEHKEVLREFARSYQQIPFLDHKAHMTEILSGMCNRVWHRRLRMLDGLGTKEARQIAFDGREFLHTLQYDLGNRLSRVSEDLQKLLSKEQEQQYWIKYSMLISKHCTEDGEIARRQATLAREKAKDNVTIVFHGMKQIEVPVSVPVDAKPMDMVSALNQRLHGTSFHRYKVYDFYDWNARLIQGALCDAQHEGRVEFRLAKRSTIQSYIEEIPELAGIQGKRYDEYMSMIGKGKYSEDNASVYVPKQEVCAMQGCGGRMILDAKEATQSCTRCGMTYSGIYLDNSRKNLPYNHAMSVKHQSSYERINHLNEWIHQIQAKERTVIPDEVIEAVRKEFFKLRLTKVGDVTLERVRRFLAKLGLNKYYEHRAQIAHRIGNTPPPYLSVADEERLRKMFLELQGPYEACPIKKRAKRSNFLSYAYTLRKLCELLGWDEFVTLFPLLKSEQRLMQHDKIWKWCCEQLGWQFIPSV